MPRVGIEPTLPTKERLLYRQTGGPPRDRRQCCSSTGGIRTHTHQGLSLAASSGWRTVPAVVVLRPRLFALLPEALGGNRTRTSAIPKRQAATTSQGRELCFRVRKKRPVGVEPTRPPWQGDRLPLHHGRGIHIQSIRRESHPRSHFGKVACCCYTTDANRSFAFKQWKRRESNPRVPA